jgi:hypothetical protein
MKAYLLHPRSWTGSCENFRSCWTCPERWTTAGYELWLHGPIGWLEVPMDFMNSAGVLCPSELCGLSQL